MKIDVQNKPVPKDLGEVVDLLKQVNTLRLLMQHETDDMKSYEAKLEEHLINEVPKSSAGVFGKQFKAKIITKLKPTLKDSAATFAWIAANQRFDMLQKRLADKAVMDYQEQTGAFPPGVEGFNAVSVSLTKI